MTEKLYYQDPFLMDFTARVLSCREEKGGYQVVLDRTAFYPEGGGQPADTGVLSVGGAEGVRVGDVREKDGEILHRCDRPLPVGASVTGQVDLAVRFDHMQQHSGEHIVSGIICRRYGCDNVGFHMGRDTVTIDFNAAIPPKDLPAIEEEANRYIWQGQAAEIEYLSGEALAAKRYRSKKALSGQVRIVSFPGADCCACCGTHVLRSGQVGLVTLLSCQRFREGVRIELLCGGRAASRCAALAEQNAKISQLLSAKPLETFQAVERQQQELHALRGRTAALEDLLFAQLAQAHAGAGDVLLFPEGLAGDGLRRLCDAVLRTCGGRCAVFSGDNREGYRYALALPDGDIRPLVKELNAALRGRGGGRGSFAQGSVQASREEITAFMRSLT